VYDYIIVGAGVAGVQAGELLAQNGKNFLILEAQTIFGGRISTIIIGQLPETAKTKWVQSNPKVAKFNIEKGATWIESGHEFMFALCKQFGVDLREQYAKGNNIYVSKDKVFTHKELMTNPEIGTKLFDAVKKF
jgi:monoamine oxidase